MMISVNEKQLEEKLRERFRGEHIRVISIKYNTSGVYKAGTNWFNVLTGVSSEINELPEYVDVRMKWRTGNFEEDIIVWCPAEWNGRFAGTAGGGTGIGGEDYIIVPDPYSRGWNVPYAVMKGYTAATADAANGKGLSDYVLDRRTGEFHRELYENWRSRTTHHMTLAGKAVAEILHDRPVEFSYMSGGSGGGRQSLTEVQEYPEDYDGIWASCPAINWNKFILSGLWANAVMNSMHHILRPEKMEYYMRSVWYAAGGKEAYFSSEKKPMFDPYSVVGELVNGSRITDMDARIMKALWEGPQDEDGNFLWYGFRPGVKYWSVGNPISVFHYSILRKKPKPLLLATFFGRWVRENPKLQFEGITIKEFAALFMESTARLADAANDKADLSAFADRGGRLIIDHGLNDPLIPVDSNIDYYNRMVDAMGQERVNEFCRFYLTPGDGHGSCYSEGPGITMDAGVNALVDWVEKGIKPGELRGVLADQRTKKIIKEKNICPVENILDWM